MSLKKDLGEFRKSPQAVKWREASYALLGNAVERGYLEYRHPNVNNGEWSYEQVDPKDRIAAARELIDRTDGKAPQAITGADGGAIKIDGSAGLLETLKRLAGG